MYASPSHLKLCCYEYDYFSSIDMYIVNERIFCFLCSHLSFSRWPCHIFAVVYYYAILQKVIILFDENESRCVRIEF